LNAFQNPIALLVATLVVVASSVAIGWIVARRTAPTAVERTETAESAPPAVDERATLRASALDSLADAVLVVDAEGRVRDCNSSALTLFDRHRDAVEEQFATALRRFDSQEQSEPYRLASQHFVWVGEGWARQPDGGMILCHARVMAIRDARSRVVAFAETYRTAVQDHSVEQEVRDLLYGVRRFEPTGTTNERLIAIRDELRILSEGFRDLDHVVRQFEKLLPSLSANDPLTESIAGAASDVRAAVSAVGMPALLEEIPLALARLRAHLQRFEADVQSATDPAAIKPKEARTGVEKRSA
jgi:PAS domain-containing protein